MIVTRYESPAGQYELTSCAPAEALRPHVLRYWGREERSTRPVARVEVPYPNVIVSVSFGPAHRVGDAAYGSFVAGLHERAVRTEHDGRVAGVQLAVTPLAAYTLFRTPMHTLASRCIELEAALGAEGRGSWSGLPSSRPGRHGSRRWTCSWQRASPSRRQSSRGLGGS